MKTTTTTSRRRIRIIIVLLLLLLLLVIIQIIPLSSYLPETAESGSIKTKQQQQQDEEQEQQQRLWCPWAYSTISSTSTSSSFCNSSNLSSSLLTTSSSSLCNNNPCKRRWIIIISTGRSASTTLTWMIDMLPNIRMSGENNNLIGNINYALQQTLTKENFIINGNNNTYNNNNIKQQKTAWSHNPVSKRLLSCAVQNIFEAMNPKLLYDTTTTTNNNNNHNNTNDDNDNDIIGFKTIRLHKNTNIKSVVEFMKESFPCAKYVINYRSNINALLKSNKKYLKEFPNKTIEEYEQEIQTLYEIKNLLLQQQEQQQQSGAGGGGEEEEVVVKMIDSEEWTKNVTILNEEIVNWMGYSKECYFTKLLEYNTKHGYENGLTQQQEQQILVDSNKCRQQQQQ